MRHNPTRRMIGLTALSTTAALATGMAGGLYELISTPPNPSPGLLNELLRKESLETEAWDLGGEERARFEYRQYFAVPGAGPAAVDFRANTPQSDNSFLLLRTRAHVGYSPSEGFTAYVEAQNSASLWDQRNPNPQNDAGIDLRQAYFRIGNPKDFPLTIKVGRQELSYGDERLVGTSDWDNFGRTFDAGKARYEKDNYWIDFFSGRVVISDDNNFNHPNWFEWFSGFYASSHTLLPKIESQLYFFADNAAQKSGTVKGTGVVGSSPRDVYTLGVRFKSQPGQFQPWDFEGEAAGQLGDFQYGARTPGVVNGQRLDQEAWAVHLTAGYSFTNVTWTPRVGLEYNFATGDKNPSDNKHQTFVNLFPTNHKFYGNMDFLSWQNLHDISAGVSAVPVKNLSLRLDYHAFWLATTSDFFYSVNQQPRTTGGYGLTPAAGSFVGQEVDFVASYRIKKWGAFEAGAGRFFTDQYVKSTLSAVGGAKDATWVYVQAKLSF